MGGADDYDVPANIDINTLRLDDPRVTLDHIGVNLDEWVAANMAQNLYTDRLDKTSLADKDLLQSGFDVFRDNARRNKSRRTFRNAVNRLN